MISPRRSSQTRKAVSRSSKKGRASKTTASSKPREVAILSDIHGNLHALTAVLQACIDRGINEYWCLGDIVGYGANPAECLQIIRALNGPTVLGNHDQSIFSRIRDRSFNVFAMAGIQYSREHLDSEAVEYLSHLPAKLVLGNATIVHASLIDPLDWHYVMDSYDARLTFTEQTTPVCFNGHTHVLKMFAMAGFPQPERISSLRYRLHPEGRVLINPGSVGQPRGGNPRAHFAIYQPDHLIVEFLQVDYDIEGAATAILQAGLPEELALRLHSGD